MKLQDYNILVILEEKRVRNAFWILALVERGGEAKRALFMNGKLQRIFTNRQEAEMFFEIYTNK